MPNSNFQERHLLKIDDYEFQDGNGIRDKYLIVLNRSDDSAYIIHTLTTKESKGFDPKKLGCHTLKNVSYFYFPKGEVVGENGFSFSLNTFIFFGENIRKESLESFSKYGNEKVVFQDILPRQTLKNIIDCMLGSMFITAEQADNLRITRNRI